MAREQFLENVRAAADYLSPAYYANGIRLNPEHLSDILREESFWLTPAAVEEFDPDDFGELSEEAREQLARDIQAFRAIAEQASAGKSPSKDQVREASARFISILSTLERHLEGFDLYHALKRQAFPEIVRDFAIKIGDDSTGDPAVWVWVILADRAAGSLAFEILQEMRTGVNAVMRRLKIDRYPYIRFRTESEQRELEMEAMSAR
jgi:hypothetical protein